MANNLIPQELDALIQQYLTDGVLTDKERQVILNKAEKLGLDRDEIDLYLDAEVQKIDQATDAAVRKQKGKQCPYCGGSVPQLTDKCPHCGENITPAASEELQDIFDNLEEALVDFKAGKDVAKSKATVERYMRKAKMYYGNNPKIQKLLQEVELESVKAEKAAKSNARKNTIVKILTYNWKITAAIIFLIIIIIGYSLYTPEEQQIQNLNSEITEKINNGDIMDACTILRTFQDDGYSFCAKYDGIYLFVVTELVKQNKYEEAEELAFAYKQKIDSFDWIHKSKIPEFLKNAFKKAGLDYPSTLGYD